MHHAVMLVIDWMECEGMFLITAALGQRLQVVIFDSPTVSGSISDSNQSSHLDVTGDLTTTNSFV